MEPKTGEESTRDSVVAADDPVETTVEVPIVRPAGGRSGADDDTTAAADDPDVTATADDADAAGGTNGTDPGAGAGDGADTATEGPDVADVLGEPAAGSGDREDDGEEETPSGRADEEPADERWGTLTPLRPDALEAVDPSTLEDDLDEDGEIIEVVEPDDMGPASQRTAGDLTAQSVLRGHSRPPESGWRRLVYEITGGLVRPRLSRSERRRVEQLRVIRTLVTQPRRIAVVSRKGGVGKTTIALMLGQTLASERGDRIIAVDGNPDAGSLGFRVGPEPPKLSITDLLNELDTVQRYADMRRFTVQTSSGLEVLRSDDDPHISTALGEQEYTAVTSLLDRFYNLILLDTGTGILDSAVQGILDGTDQIVLVVAPSLDAARAASQTLDWLTEHGYVGLVESAVTVINQVKRSALVDVSRIEEHFWDRCGATVRVPWDRYLEAGAETELGDLRPATREAFVQLAAAVASRFDT